MKETVHFSSGAVDYYFDSSFAALEGLVPVEDCIILTDRTVARLCKKRLQPYRTVVIPSGEKHKTMKTVLRIAEELVKLQAHRKTMLVGVGGGVVTDITGFVAATYMRGLPFALVPTTLLGMVDAAIGGKNGVNIGLHKNLLGTVRQPRFLLFDYSFLNTLPNVEIINGFAEVIKYACVFDDSLFLMLETTDPWYLTSTGELIDTVVRFSADWKNKTVMADETETGVRKLLNFGHTLGHAIETTYQLPHGEAVAVGMSFAASLSVKVAGLSPAGSIRLRNLLGKYRLPTDRYLDVDKVMEVLRMDKKRNNEAVDFIVLEEIGRGVIKAIDFVVIEQLLKKRFE